MLQSGWLQGCEEVGHRHLGLLEYPANEPSIQIAGSVVWDCGPSTIQMLQNDMASTLVIEFETQIV